MMITKICGIQNEDTLICCEENSVDFFGMIFYPKSPRNISIKDAINFDNDEHFHPAPYQK